MEMGGGSAAGFGLDKICGVGSDFEDHVAGVEANDGLRIGMQVVHEHVRFVDGVCCRGSLFGGNLVKRG